MTPTPPRDDPTVPSVKRGWRVARLLAVFALLVTFAIATIWIYRECTFVRSVDINDLASSEVTCAPPTITSATVLLVLLLVVALLWPDISEVTVLGVTLKRRIAAAESKATAARKGIEDLRATVLLQQVQINAVVRANSTASAVVHNHFGSDAWGPDERQRLREESARVANDAGGYRADGPPEERDRVASSVAELKMELLEKYEALADVLDLHALRGRGRPTTGEAQKRRVQEWFIADYAPALDSVRQLRNAIAHAREVSRDDVSEGLAVLDRLLPAAGDWVAQHDAGDQTAR
ncbi:hypothetical protein GCM10027427_18060 [Pseudoclavibacter terrae]